MKKFLLVITLLLNFSILAQNIAPQLGNFRVKSSSKNRIYFDSTEPLKGSSYKGFKLSSNSVSGISINSGKTTGHYLKLSSSLNYWSNITVRYSGGSNLESTKSKDLQPFTLQHVENNIPEPSYNGKVYYVSTRGSNSKSGTSKSNAWKTITYAASKARAGDVVYIKAGNYGKEYINMKYSGTTSKPIKFIGYKSSPEDINKMYYKRGGGSLKSGEMPLLNGVNKEKAAIRILGSKYIIIKNLQITKYDEGIDGNSSSAFNVFDNILVKDVGNSSAGYGIILNNLAGSNKILNTTIINATNSLIRIYGDHNLIDNFKGYCDYGPNNGPATDYYVSIYKGSHNIITNSYIERVGNIAHTGHGISVKASGRKSEFNLIQNSQVKNIGQAVQLRHTEVKYNVVRNILFTGSKSQGANGVVLRDNTSYNTIEGCTMYKLGMGVRFADNSSELGTQMGGHHNKIINSVFNGCDVNIVSSGLDGTAKPSKYNEILNCTFYNSLFMFSLKESFGSSNKMINCNIVNVKSKIKRGSASLKISESYNNYYNGYSKPSGTGNISKNPSFIGASSNNFRLKKGSPLINKGKNLSQVSSDFNRISRSSGGSHDIGAFEFSEEGQVLPEPESPENEDPIVEDTPIQNCDEFEAWAGKNVRINIGESVTLKVTGGDTYLWSFGATTQSVTVSPTKTKYYRVTVFKDGCQDTDTVGVIVSTEYMENSDGSVISDLDNPQEVNDEPVKEETPLVQNCDNVKAWAGRNVTIKRGESVTLTATGGDTYLWSFGATAQSVTVSPTKTKYYKVTAFKNGCEDTDTVGVIVESGKNSLSNEKSREVFLDENKIQVYPNPSSNLVNIKVSGSLSIEQIFLFDDHGRLVYSEIIQAATKNNFAKTIDLARFRKGLYIIKFNSKEKSITKKLLVN